MKRRKKKKKEEDEKGGRRRRKEGGGGEAPTVLPYQLEKPNLYMVSCKNKSTHGGLNNGQEIEKLNCKENLISIFHLLL